MWIFFGSKTKTKNDGRVISEPCRECGNNSYNITTLYNYFHLYWIPFISTGKKYILECSNCKAVYEKKNLTEKMKSDLKKKSRSSTPFYHFTGLFLFLLFGLFIGWVIHEDDLRTKKYLMNPAVGDYYVVNHKKLFKEKIGKSTENLDYTVLKVIKKSNTTIGLLIGNFIYKRYTDGETAIDNRTVLKKNYFTQYTYEIKRNRLLPLFDKDVICIVKREQQNSK